ncbi:MAG TPA: hypothetical protein GX733_04705 [Tissierellia bacterium]|nr:hypothetical protein [Tissierellia bacterium]
MKTPRLLLDDIGNVRERKNLYLKELFEAEAAGRQEEVNNLKAHRSSHPYLLSLREAKEKEAVFLRELKQQVETYERSLSSDDPLKKLKVDAFEAAEKATFYQPLRELSYDFELLDRIYHFRLDQLPRIIGD